MHCDQCNAAMIQGVFCHETGCPNSRKTWDPESECWRTGVACWQCGEIVFEGEVCCCYDPLEDCIETPELIEPSYTCFRCNRLEGNCEC